MLFIWGLGPRAHTDWSYFGSEQAAKPTQRIQSGRRKDRAKTTCRAPGPTSILLGAS